MSEFLETHRDNARDTIYDTLPGLVSGALSHADLLWVCESHRIAGLVGLLLDADPDELHGRLFDAGRAYLFGLGTVATRQIVVSRAQPLFDALACRDEQGALAIARHLAPLPWQRDVEYEDDFLFMAWLAQWVREELGAGAGSSERVPRAARLTTLEEAAAGAPRALVARALEGADAPAFEAGLLALVEAYQSHQRLLVEREAISPEAAATLPYVCVESLALLELARHRGLAVAPEHPGAPSLARAQAAPRYAPDAWRTPR
jgi:hypothetical protein